MDQQLQISMVIPSFNEEESLPELTAWIAQVMAREGYSYEVLLIDDGSTDQSWNVIKKLASADHHIRGIRFRRNYGKSAALNTGFQASRGKVVITMDADLQDSPEEIPELYKMITTDGYDLVSGWKQKRYDNTFTKNIPSKLYNWANRKISGIKLHDMNCGLKAYNSKVVKSIEVYGEMHRYIPVIAKGAGFKKIGEKVVQHRARKYGSTKFGMERFINGFLDLLTIAFMNKFSKRPMHLFGTLGVLSFIIGSFILIYLSIMKLMYAQYGIASRPLFFFGILALIIGSQLFVTGFLAELMVRNSAVRNLYQIEEEIG
ncbi:MAG TPA: glycosyltransferase family 2 protein [Saprospiraceae bacterium]|nr:glycosyltransferase family 2 protein [Saprospiraceae bacterium]HMW74905.1 glycosyltransferase family 2 protein [Saprospiraceae bacterium]HMX82257.1 glycosyltransferase family 2 protein [Saprospiraceae bacterium]HMX85429.1 glycosyltransferase family 2 protein [Saprospiraceae bacterium]HMZ74031.1 glycosyltransferase family 2 protein [Saprospiraceae bacterium]